MRKISVFLRLFLFVPVISLTLACSISFSYIPGPAKTSTPTSSPTHTPTLTAAPTTTPTLAPTPTETNLFDLLDNIEKIEELACIHAIGASREGIGGKIRFSPDGRLLAVPALQSIYLYQVPSLTAASNFYAGGNVSDIEFTPDGKHLASGSWDRSINLWNVNDGSRVLELELSAPGVNSIDISPGGGLIASGGWDSIISFWSLPDGRFVRKINAESRSIFYVSFSADEKYLVSSGFGITLWKVSDGSKKLKIDGHSDQVAAANFSPDGTVLVSASWDGTIKMWSLPDGKIIRTLIDRNMGIGAVTCISISPDGRLLSSAGADHVVRLWKMSDGSLLRVLRGHRSTVTSVAFSPDGSLLASASDDGDVRLWGIPSKK